MNGSSLRALPAQPLAEGTVALGELALESGARLEELEVAYQTWGKPSREAILVCHALTGSADAADWWSGLIGPGRALDPECDFIVASNVLGGCYGTTGPASRSSNLARPYGPDFPDITVRDMVHAQARWLDAIGVDQLSLVVGGSMGGMLVLEWALLYPERVAAIAPIATSAAHSAWCIGTSSAQREAIRQDPAWRGGYYGGGVGPQAGLDIARRIAMQSYRTRESFEERFSRDRAEGGGFEVESYLRYQGEKLNQRFDANSYLTLTEAMDSHDVGRDRGGVEAALATIDQPTLVVGIDSDGLYPLTEQRELAELVPRAELEIVSSMHGHDGFLIEDAEIGRRLLDFRRALEEPPRRAACCS
ncbi:MAG: homoserine O-acetyltransferase [Acidobacteriota bacterium]